MDPQISYKTKHRKKNAKENENNGDGSIELINITLIHVILTKDFIIFGYYCFTIVKLL